MLAPLDHMMMMSKGLGPMIPQKLGMVTQGKQRSYMW
jgi:hypothetical protein